VTQGDLTDCLKVTAEYWATIKMKAIIKENRKDFRKGN
jgi:hypothetical protein